MKRCTLCLRRKPLSGFYDHINQCKACVKARVKKHRLDNIDRIKAYDRARDDDPHRVELRRAYREKVRRDPVLWKKRLLYSIKHNRKNILQRKARRVINNGIRDGKIKKKPCEKCGTKKRIEAHHDDYTKPLKVRWLCRKHHGELHRLINKQRRS